MAKSISVLAGLCLLLNVCIAQKGVRLSQFERAGETDLLIDRNNVLHAVFQESPDFGKPVFIYYTSSSNNGASWSKPVAISNDESGNGAGPPVIVQDGNGAIYVIWKRYGNKGSKYPVKEVTLDGRGGYVNGTLFYKVLQAGQWSEIYPVSQEIGSQYSWFAFVNNKGQLYVCWNEVSPQSVQNNWQMWYYADWVRFGILGLTGVTARAEVAPPAAPKISGGAPPENGVINLHGYADAEGNVHYTYTRRDPADKKQEKIYYYDGRAHKEVYAYPLNSNQNHFMHPPRLLYDDKGVDHIVFRPSSTNLESEQIWDITPVNNKKTIIADISTKGYSISGFQAHQSAPGKMTTCVEFGGTGESGEAMGLFYDAVRKSWIPRALTKNAGKGSFKYTRLTPLAYLSTLTTYLAQAATVVTGKDGKRKMLLTLAVRTSTGGYSMNNPSVLFFNID